MMEKLNELIKLANLANIAGQGTAQMADFRVTANPDTILAIAEAFRELEQRAEAAEATIRQQDELILSYQETIRRQTGAIDKLGELETQEPVAYTDNEQIADLHKSTFAEIYPPHDSFKGDPEWLPLYLRPAHAINLAELVPDEKSTDVDYAYYPLTKARHEGWNACRAAILRKIEEANK